MLTSHYDVVISYSLLLYVADKTGNCIEKVISKTKIVAIAHR